MRQHGKGDRAVTAVGHKRETVGERPAADWAAAFVAVAAGLAGLAALIAYLQMPKSLKRINEKPAAEFWKE